MKQGYGNSSLEVEPHAPLLPVHPYQLVTAQDLEQFRQRLMIELAQLVKDHLNITSKKWLKSHEVRKLLKISPGTLQTLKSNGTIPYSRVGGIHYYEYEKIIAMMKLGDSAAQRERAF